MSSWNGDWLTIRSNKRIGLYIHYTLKIEDKILIQFQKKGIGCNYGFLIRKANGNRVNPNQ